MALLIDVRDQDLESDNAPPENAGPITASTAFLSHLAPGAVMYSMFVAGRFSAGTGVAVDAAGDAWVCGSEGLRPLSHSFVEKISPIAGTPDSLTLAEDSPPVSVTLTATDIDGPSLTLSLGAAPAHGTVSAVSATTCQFYNYRSTCTASVSYSPAPDYFGADSFSFTAGDGTLVSPPAAVSIDITPVNDAPLAAAQFVAVAEDSSVTITVTANDIDNISLSLALLPGSGPFHGALSGISAPGWDGAY